MGDGRRTPSTGYVEFVLEDEFEELGGVEAVGGGLLQADRKALGQAGEAELTEHGEELGIHGVKQSGVSCW